ncbi:MAG: hypothetical protein PHT79_11145 [Syntrophomonadaceae bacterium]|nr:hypothetical protein [Dysgonamonadaceae bacterium]MDD3901434.1 hypothetical protein [Dysgonamonadaceae bacterium]MDD4550300.1 hypothetical protein [Syntrophomonadaceae bacterium]
MNFYELLVAKAKGIDGIRYSLNEEGFIEVFTPIITNRVDFPLKEHFSIKQKSFYLRICMELRLRQLLSFGFNGVYELGPCFRNEKDENKLIEFYLLEVFKRNAKYNDLITLSENICKGVFTTLGNQDYNFNWKRFKVISLVSEEEISYIRNNVENDIEFIDEFDKKIEDAVSNITEKAYFVVDYPVETISLAKRMDNDPKYIERFELYINKEEIAHGFIDCCDGADIATRMNNIKWSDKYLLKQLEKKELPESGGFGIGIERLIQAALNITDIKQIVVGDNIM